MPAAYSHRPTNSTVQNQKALLANAYNELGKELSSSKIRVVGNYTLGKVIGEGAYGKVRIGTHRLTSTRVAIKQIPKAMSASLTREIHHHRQLHHPHIIQMYEVIATESHIWIVTELCSGGELFDYLVEKGRLAEDETKIVFGQLCLAVNYLHEKNIVHRDLKLENVLLDQRCRVKLGDFGFTREFDKGSLMETFCGTTGYAAPEMLQGRKYTGPEVDVWSLGVILYTLLTGTLPFDDDDESEMRSKVIAGNYEDPEWLSADARDLINRIFERDTTKRITIPQILAHQWFKYRTNFTSQLTESPTRVTTDTPLSGQIQFPLADASTAGKDDSHLSSETSHSSASDSSFMSPSAETGISTPTTPEDVLNDDPFYGPLKGGSSDVTKSADSKPKVRPILINIPRNPSETTIRRGETGAGTSSSTKRTTNVILEESDGDDASAVFPAMQDKPLPNPPQSTPRARTASTGSRSRMPPPMHPARTPARTKRRSASSTFSDGEESPSSPTQEKSSTALLPFPQGSSAIVCASDTISTGKPISEENAINLPRPPPDILIDFANLLSAPAPIIFSTPLERDLLNSLSALGFDTAQIVHSVLSDACDAAGALWWMLKKKAEKKVLEDAETALVKAQQQSSTKGKEKEKEKDGAAATSTSSSRDAVSRAISTKHKTRVNAGVQTDDSAPRPTAPQFAFVPPTPTLPRVQTPPPRSGTPTKSMLSPSSSTTFSGEGSGMNTSKSHPGTPSGSMKEKDWRDRDKDKDKDKDRRKPRSGSVSIMQRATTALEAAGLVRKKSTEGVKEEREREKERERERSKDADRDRRLGSADEARSSYASTTGGASSSSTKLTKSPPLRPTKDTQLGQAIMSIPVLGSSNSTVQIGGSASESSTTSVGGLQPPSTPPPGEHHKHHHSGIMGSPWVLTDSKESLTRTAGAAAAAAAGTQTPGTQQVQHPVMASVSSTAVGNGHYSHLQAGEMTASSSAPNLGGSASSGSTTTSPNQPPAPPRNRANILTAFRLWFNEDRKGKRKEGAAAANAGAGQNVGGTTMQYPGAGSDRRGMSTPAKRRGSNSSNKYVTGSGHGREGKGGPGSGSGQAHKTQRPSISSRRSSSVNSRRSSGGASIQMLVLDSPQLGKRRSFGAHTPNSDRGEYSSRPSSVKSFSMQSQGQGQGHGRHKKSPSNGSGGSAGQYHRTASPLQSKYHNHRRAGSSGSSTTTRVMRQYSGGGPGSGSVTRTPRAHIRSNSATSSLHSPASSRPGSYYEHSENEGFGPGFGINSSRGTSPFRRTKKHSGVGYGDETTPRRHASGSSAGSTTFIAHKKQGPFMSPLSYSGGYSYAYNSIGRSSWKKSWGLEPPGWKTRQAAPLSVEVLAISSAGGSGEPTSIRDVFSAKQQADGSNASTGDESDWVDEDEDLVLAGGLGQTGFGAAGYGSGNTAASPASSGVGSSSNGGSNNMSNSISGSNQLYMEPSPGPPGRGPSSSSSSSKRSTPTGRGLNLNMQSGASGSTGSTGTGRQMGMKQGQGRVSPIPTEPVGGLGATGRRQLPAGRSGPAFRQAIQEEDEDEEE